MCEVVDETPESPGTNTQQLRCPTLPKALLNHVSHHLQAVYLLHAHSPSLLHHSSLVLNKHGKSQKGERGHYLFAATPTLSSLQIGFPAVRIIGNFKNGEIVQAKLLTQYTRLIFIENFIVGKQGDQKLMKDWSIYHVFHRVSVEYSPMPEAINERPMLRSVPKGR